MASSTLKIKYGIAKGMQETVFIIDVWCGLKSIYPDHCSASLGKPRDADQ